MSRTRLAGVCAGLRALRPTSPVDADDARWLGWPLAVGLAVVALYVATNDYPAYGAGLYTLTADTVRANGYALPATVPHYGPEGVPFAYPPLVFYVLAALRSLGAGTFATALYLPPVVTVATLVPAYLLGRDVVDDRRAGTAAALLVVLNPQVLEWHISAGGLVRAPAFLFALCGSYAALRLFRDRDVEWLPVGLVTVALVAHTHPTYTVFTVATYLLFWAGYDRSLAGLGRGAAVGLGALAVATPWLLTVVTYHGPSVFAGAAGTHGGLLGVIYRLREWGPTGAVLPLVCAVGLLATRHRVVGAWTVVVWLLFAQPRFTYAVGAVAVVAAVAELAERGYLDSVRARGPGAVVAAMVVVSAVGLGGLAYEFAGSGDDTTPEFVDDDDVAAMEWAAAETPPGSTFVVFGDAAEWFPVVAERTILVSPWGAEWRGPNTYQPHLDAFVTGSQCNSVACADAEMASVDARPDYVYLPRGAYTVRGDRQWADGSLRQSFENSARYEPVFRNDGVVVFRRVSASER